MIVSMRQAQRAVSQKSVSWITLDPRLCVSGDCCGTECGNLVFFGSYADPARGLSPWLTPSNNLLLIGLLLSCALALRPFRASSTMSRRCGVWRAAPGAQALRGYARNGPTPHG